jgi:hypothetical protein
VVAEPGSVPHQGEGQVRGYLLTGGRRASSWSAMSNQWARVGKVLAEGQHN